MARTPEEILADQAAAAGGAEEIEDFSTEDIVDAEDALSASDANDAADLREEGIETDNDTIDTLVAESQEISDETIDSDGHDRG
jgi:N utilization substance protein A